MRTLNRVTLMGNLAADPDVRETKSGIKVANFSIATNRNWKTEDGKQKRATDFHRVIAWRKLGEICGEYLKKGSSIYLEGLLRNHSYKTKEGENRYITEIVASNVNILTWKKTEDGEPKASIDPIIEEEPIDEESDPDEDSD